MPSQDRGLLARVDALAADRRGLALLSDGRLAAAKARLAARAVGLATGPAPTRAARVWRAAGASARVSVARVPRFLEVSEKFSSMSGPPGE